MISPPSQSWLRVRGYPHIHVLPFALFDLHLDDIAP